MPFWHRNTAIIAAWLAEYKLHPIFSMYAFTKPADFEFFPREGTKVGRTAGAWGDLTRRTTLERVN